MCVSKLAGGHCWTVTGRQSGVPVGSGWSTWSYYNTIVVLKAAVCLHLLLFLMIFLLFVLLLLINQLCCNAGSVCLNKQNREINQYRCSNASGGGGRGLSAEAELCVAGREKRDTGSLDSSGGRSDFLSAAGRLKRGAIEPFITAKRREKLIAGSGATRLTFVERNHTAWIYITGHGTGFYRHTLCQI